MAMAIGDGSIKKLSSPSPVLKTSFDLRIKGIDKIQKKNQPSSSVTSGEPANFITPGRVITREIGFMRGHGTYTNVEDQCLVGSLVGTVERVNRLISVKGVGGVYYGEVGDVVVGRITKVMRKRWKVDINSRLDGILLISSINLPTGELRRRSAEDELAMREILKEGDVISAEIQSVYNDGSLALHTRSVKYGKLGPGTMIKVSSLLIKRRKNHIHNLPGGTSIIIGNNGLVWISPLPNGRMPGTNLEEDLPGGKTTLEEISVSTADRTNVARLRNCISALATLWLPIYDTSVMYAHEASMRYEVAELLMVEVINEIGEAVRTRLAAHAQDNYE